MFSKNIRQLWFCKMASGYKVKTFFFKIFHVVKMNLQKRGSVTPILTDVEKLEKGHLASQKKKKQQTSGKRGAPVLGLFVFLGLTVISLTFLAVFR